MPRPVEPPSGEICDPRQYSSFLTICPSDLFALFNPVIKAVTPVIASQGEAEREN
jgi:hypothetical protein